MKRLKTLFKPPRSNTFEATKSFDFQVLDQLVDSNHPVYLIASKTTDEHFLLKIYPYVEGEVSQVYVTQVRMMKYSHENILRITKAEEKQETRYRGVRFTASYLICEFALYGTFFRITQYTSFSLDETLVRTYFRQLIEGLEYLHDHQIAHLDLKLDYLWLTQDLVLKIGNFETVYMEGDKKITTRGTENYRAPELKAMQCKNPYKADIYSAGIILFILRSKTFPFIEDFLYYGLDMYKILEHDNKEFWKAHLKVRNNEIFYSEEFKELFISMVREDPEKRASIKDIKNSKWYQGPVYSGEELAKKIVPKLLELPEMKDDE
jgi:Serine/threonine protein kinase